MSDSCELVDCSPPGSSVHGILQARVLEWVALLTPRGSSQHRDWTCVSPIKLALASGFLTTSATWEPLLSVCTHPVGPVFLENPDQYTLCAHTHPCSFPQSLFTSCRGPHQHAAVLFIVSSVYSVSVPNRSSPRAGQICLLPLPSERVCLLFSALCCQKCWEHSRCGRSWLNEWMVRLIW